MPIKLQNCSLEFIRECFPDQDSPVVFDKEQNALFFLLENSVIVNKLRWLELQSPSGEHKLWRENGQLWSCGPVVLWSCGSWVDGKQQGEHKKWYGNGQLWSYGFWVDGLREGEHKSWHKNGQLSYRGSYVNGKQVEETVENLGTEN